MNGQPRNSRLPSLLQGLSSFHPHLSLLWTPPVVLPAHQATPIRTTIPYFGLLPQLFFGAIRAKAQANIVNQAPTNVDLSTAPSTDSSATEPASEEQNDETTKEVNEKQKIEKGDSETKNTNPETEPSTPENAKSEDPSRETSKIDFRSVETLSRGTPLVDSTQRLNKDSFSPKTLKRAMKRPADDDMPIRKRRRTNENGPNSSQVMCHCDFCGKGFTRQWLLQGHIRTHTGEKPFKCQVCGKPFADKSNLRAHVQTHSDEKPFACVRCGKRFALKSYLSKHEESACSLRNRPRPLIGNPAINLGFGFLSPSSLVYR